MDEHNLASLALVLEKGDPTVQHDFQAAGFGVVLDLEVSGHLMNVPSRSSAYACWSCSCVFMTIGPYHATGSSIGLPDTSRNRMPSSPAWTVTSSPLSKRTSDRFPISDAPAGSALSTRSVLTPLGCDA